MLCMIKRISEVIVYIKDLCLYTVQKEHQRGVHISDNSLDLSALLNNKSDLFVFSNLIDSFDWIDCNDLLLWYHVDVALSKLHLFAVLSPTPTPAAAGLSVVLIAMPGTHCLNGEWAGGSGRQCVFVECLQGCVQTPCGLAD